LYVLIFFSVTSKYSEDEPIIYKLSEFKKIQVMKNQHVLLKIMETKYCSVHCHALEQTWGQLLSNVIDYNRVWNNRMPDCPCRAKFDTGK